MLSLLIILTGAFMSTYFLVENSGIFGMAPPTDLKILYSRPFLASSIALLLLVVIWTIGNIRKMKTAGWGKVITALLLIAGLWVSYLTRFSVVVVLTEGQTFYSGHRQNEPRSMYTGRFTTVPDVGIKLERLNPEFSAGGRDMKRLQGKILFYSRQAQSKSEHDLSNMMPVVIGGTWISLGDFGYSPRYALKSKGGRVLDSSFVYMRLFPPGSEDSFRLLSPLTYYVRYYPAGTDEGTDPVIRLRIVRNKDIVFNDDVKLSEDVAYENSRIAIEEVRMWTQLSITRDWGQAIAMIGIITGLLTLMADMMRWRKRKA